MTTTIFYSALWYNEKISDGVHMWHWELIQTPEGRTDLRLCGDSPLQFRLFAKRQWYDVLVAKEH